MVNKDSVLNKIKTCNDLVYKLRTEREQVQKKVKDIHQIWKHSDYENFASEMENFARELENLEKQIQTYNDFVNGYIVTENLLDNTYRSKQISIE